MPGNTPREAFEAFIEPLQRAVSVLGQNKLTASRGGKDVVGKVHAWTLNSAAGVGSKGWHFDASMNYEIIRDDREGYGPFRVTTRSYRYQVALAFQDIARFHWHPDGVSDFVAPHVHLRLELPERPGERPPDMLTKHMPTPRMSFEDAVGWAAEMGMPMARDDWREVLENCQRKHREHRTWA